MIPYIGDFAEDESVVHYFNTFDSNDPSASVTITNLVDADLKVHKDGSVTDIVTDGATIAIDFDTITGTHKVTIDTSVHADYAIGADYMVRMEGTTVDAGTINAALFTFSIENRYNAAADDLANGTDGLGALKTLIDAVQTVVDKVPVSDGTTSWNATALAAINGEVADVLKTDTVAEMAQQAPPTTPTFEEAIMYLYMSLVHEGTVTSTSKTFSNNAGTVIWKKTLSDDTTTYTEAEGATGP